jgi:hypothetical protein
MHMRRRIHALTHSTTLLHIRTTIHTCINTCMHTYMHTFIHRSTCVGHTHIHVYFRSLTCIWGGGHMPKPYT